MDCVPKSWAKMNCPLYVASCQIFSHILVSVSTAAMKHHGQEASCKKKGLFDLHFYITIHHQRKPGQEPKQGRNLEAGSDAEAVEECCLLTCSTWLCLLSCKVADHQPRDATTHNVPDPPHNRLRKCSPGLPTIWPYGSMFSIEDSSFQITLPCVKLTKDQPAQGTPCQLDTQAHHY